MLKILKFLKPFILSVIAVIVLVFIQSVTELLLPNLMANIVDTGIMNGDVSFIYKTGGIMILIALVGSVSSILAGFLSSKASAGMAMNIRNKEFSHIEEFSVMDINKFGTASLITRTTNDIQQIQTVVFISLRMIISAPTMMIGGIILAINKDVGTSWVFVAAVPVLILVIGVISARGFPLFKSLQNKLDKLNIIFREGITGIKVIRAFTRIKHQNEKFNSANASLAETALNVNRLMASLMPVLMLILNLTSVAIIWIGSKRINANALMVGDLMAFIQYAMLILMSFVMMSMMFIIIPRASASAYRINEVLEREPMIDDSSFTKETSEIKGYLEVKNVKFAYPHAQEAALSDISFSAKPGQVTAIIGSTGSGKTTLINLLMRFYEPIKGEILVDGLNANEMSQEYLRAKIGYVPQKAVLFSGTIEDNIRYGKNDATKDEVINAARTAQALEFIEKKPEQFESRVAQGGENFSGGQKQRLCIARALVRRAEIYIFDDSFSALDAKTDANLRAALKEQTTEATVIIISQKVSTVMYADQILVLDDGKLVGIGKHNELLKACEVYKDIVESQFRKEADAQ